VILSHIAPGNAEWDRAWNTMAANPVNAGLEHPHVAFNESWGETWQYMGTVNGQHEFRHRMHPTTDKREYLKIPATSV